MDLEVVLRGFGQDRRIVEALQVSNPNMKAVNTKDEPNKAMRTELANANAMWMAVAQQPTKERLKGADAAIEKSCAKLKKLDQ